MLMQYKIVHPSVIFVKFQLIFSCGGEVDILFSIGDVCFHLAMCMTLYTNTAIPWQVGAIVPVCRGCLRVGSGFIANPAPICGHMMLRLQFPLHIDAHNSIMCL